MDSFFSRNMTSPHRAPRLRSIPCLLGLVLTTAGHAQSGALPSITAPITAPVGDASYPGVIALSVDATDFERRIMRVVETLPVRGGPLVLLYPQWLPGTHSPSGRLDGLAGLVCVDSSAGPVPSISAVAPSDPRRLAWTRDPGDAWAFRFDIPAGTSRMSCEFQFLSPLEGATGREVMTPAIVGVQWNQVLLYPAGVASNRITFKPRLRIPDGWAFASALEAEGASPMQSTGAPIDFAATTLETLIDSPLFAGRHTRRFDLDPGAAAAGRPPVRLDVVADREASLDAKPDDLEAHRRLVQQADRLFGSRHYAHYDFLFALSDQFGGIGLEHQQSSENGVRPGYFTDIKSSLSSRSLLPHEYTHSWNGKFRRPADLATPNFNVPMQDSLLWVYEGQTQYWGHVLAARSGIVDPQTARDVQAVIAASYDARAGRVWRNLQDTTNQPIVGGRADTEWTDWLRGADYYDEMDLVWLDVDTKIRELSNGRRSLDDFARTFFGVENGRTTVLPYRFDDIVAALTAVQPFDWRTMLRARLDGYGPGAPLEGLARAGWKLVFDDQESEYLKSSASARHIAGFAYSLGFDVTTDSGRTPGGRITNLRWNGPGFEAGLVGRMTLVAVNGRSFTPELLKEAILANRGGQQPIELIAKSGDYYRTVRIDYRNGLRYPHLARVEGTPDRLSAIFAAKLK